jgi:hypothetical protein
MIRSAPAAPPKTPTAPPETPVKPDVRPDAPERERPIFVPPSPNRPEPCPGQPKRERDDDDGWGTCGVPKVTRPLDQRSLNSLRVPLREG